MTNPEQEFATVDEVIVMLQKLSTEGCGGYFVVCNSEYFLARKDEVPVVDHGYRQVDLGGYA